MLLSFFTYQHLWLMWPGLAGNDFRNDDTDEVRAFFFISFSLHVGQKYFSLRYAPLPEGRYCNSSRTKEPPQP